MNASFALNETVQWCIYGQQYHQFVASVVIAYVEAMKFIKMNYLKKTKKIVCKTKQAMTMCSAAEYYHQQVSQFPFKMSAGKTESGSMSNSMSDRERKSNKTSAFNKILFDLISLFVN